jgi:hypothetical protein
MLVPFQVAFKENPEFAYPIVRQGCSPSGMKEIARVTVIPANLC